MEQNTTIAAVSTPYGRGGIAVIRVSGTDAIAICDRIFMTGSHKRLSELPAGQTVWGHILQNDTVIDDGMATVFRAPRSFTGEDTVELSCHGGILLTQTVLAAVFAAGAVQAGPGEFTKRAFLNGKMGLSQAESVINLIDAENTEQMRLAGAGARGKLSAEVDTIAAQLRHAISSTYAYIDYPDEDLTELTAEELKASFQAVQQKLKRLQESYRTGKAVSQGIRCAIVGKPNTGKSSLLNLLTGEDRAIVTEIAGTTRDVLEQSVSIGKIMLRLSDTAGIRETEDVVESFGVERAVRALQSAELILAVFDGAQPLDAEDARMLDLLKLKQALCPVIAIVNKTDLQQQLTLPETDFAAVIAISAKTGAGLDALTAKIEELFLDGSIDYDTQAVVTNARQYAAVDAAYHHMENAVHALESGFSQDVAGLDAEQCLTALGEVDARCVTGEIVDEIFHRFCVGK